VSKIISLYNNKGGVSKTTTLFNLGVYFSQEDKKILLVDCDPQCNMTELFFASNDDLSDPEVDLPGTSVYEALECRFKGEQASIPPESITLCEHPLYENLSLFKGDLEFTRAESYFATAWSQAITENIHEKHTYIVFEKMLRALGEYSQFDYILCDVGPSTGAITRTVILSCDELVVPLVPDRFCYQAVRLLGNIISEWSRKHKMICNELTPFGIEPFEGDPKLAGTVVQNFKVHCGVKAKQSYIQWQEKISNEIATNLVGSGGLTPKDGFDPKAPYTASIRDVAVLAPVSQIFGRAIFDIRQEHTKEASTDGRMYYGSVWEPWVTRMSEYRQEISKIAQALS
jgi:chromosome partitioning protein